jgi:hypothetical protein
VALRYDPVTNPTGARGTFWDGIVNAFGKDPATGFARNAYDNVGIQYGLNALNRDEITVDEFLDLNENVGGLDIDGNFIPERSVGDPIAIRNTYRTGRLVTGENQIVPTIDTRLYTDLIIDIHTRVRTFAMMERMLRVNGTTANQVNWMTALGGSAGVDTAQLALQAHNEWLENILADPSDDPYEDKVIRNKPAWVTDTCWESDGTPHEEQFTLAPDTMCNSLFPVFSTVRIEAGGPLAGDVMKCRTKEVDFDDYSVAFTPERQVRMNAIFPQGVCDFSVPGFQQKPIKGTWLDFG